MAEQYGLVRSRTGRNGSTVAGIPVRVLVSEEHDLTSQVTRYPVENGQSISDHVILNPNTVSIRFEMPNSNRGEAEAHSVLMKFIKMRDERSLLTLDTQHARYKDMVVTVINSKHSAPYKGALVFSVKLEQAGIVGGIDTVSVPGGRDPEVLSQDGTERTACAPKRGGEKQAIIQSPILKQCIHCMRMTSARSA